MATEVQTYNVPKGKLARRVVTGKFHGIGKDGKRFVARPGDVVALTPDQAVAFADVMEDPIIADAQATAMRAAREAAERAEREAKEAAQVARSSAAAE